jgi:hypothetical protein
MEVVDDDDTVEGLRQGGRDRAADKPGPAGH